MGSLKKENRLLKALIEILPKPKRTSRKKLKKNESSHLQMYLLLRTSEGKYIKWTQAEVQEIDTEQKFKGLDEIDLMEMIYDLKKANLAEDKNYLEAVQRELARREAMKGNALSSCHSSSHGLSVRAILGCESSINSFRVSW